MSVTVLDRRGGLLGTKHFKVSGVGHRAMWDWVQTFGPVARFGIENASGIGGHTSTFSSSVVSTSATCVRRALLSRPRRRREGKSDALPVAFKRAGPDRVPDPVHEQILLWHKARRSLVKTRVHLLNEADHLIVELPLELREQLPRTSDVRRLLRGLRALEPASGLTR